ncbi:unnamed protein product [Rotaria socialis]|uniref:Uncharacterized protein n=1 Tax=Rotaria socialis TaxID=392032 RepID=A0A820VBW3_9BILA|nr:unnamed protein product [Rotaria socialis]
MARRCTSTEAEESLKEFDDTILYLCLSPTFETNICSAGMFQGITSGDQAEFNAIINDYDELKEKRPQGPASQQNHILELGLETLSA